MEKKNYSKLVSFILEKIDYANFPSEKILDNKSIPYSQGCFISSPLIHYLRENKYYESYASGNIDDFGILNIEFQNIPSNKFIKIITIDSETFKIYWLDHDFDDVLSIIMRKTDYDWRVFDKLGLITKSKIIKFKFNSEDEFIENIDENITSTNIYNYNELRIKYSLNT